MLCRKGKYMVELKFDNTNRNFDQFVNSEYDTEAALDLQIDIVNACAEISKNLTYRKDDTQKRLLLQTALGLLEVVKNFPER